MTRVDFSKLLGNRYVEQEGDVRVKERLDLASSLIRNYGNAQYGKNSIIQELLAVETDKELLAFCKEYFKIDIPYIPVCEDHQSPGQAFCDAYFGRAQDSLWWASRASFKSYGTGLLTVLDTLRHKGCETKILAGSMEQGNNVYGAAETHIYTAGLEHMFKMRRTYTEAITGSNFSVLTASPKSARGPHPNILRLDEVDEIPREIFDAAINQPMTKNGIQAQTLMTSTMHKVYGLMSELIDAAPDTGLKVYTWCYAEVTEKCHEPDCTNLTLSDRFRGMPCPLLGNRVENIYMLPEDERARLVPAREYVNDSGLNDDGSTMMGYYDGSCQGKLRHASGYVSVDDQRAARMRVPKKTWEVENECRRPSQEDMVYDPILLQRGTVRHIDWDYTLPPERSWAMVDWGFNNPTAFIIAQDQVIPGRSTTLKPYHHCLIKEWYWEQRGLNWRVEQITNIIMERNIRQVYADAENIDALVALRDSLKAHRYECLVRGVAFNRFKERLIENIRHDMEIGHWFISQDGCPNTLRDLYKLHYRPNTEDVAKENDHGPDAIVAGWRRFIQLGDLQNASGEDLASVGRVRDLMRPGHQLNPSLGASRKAHSLHDESPLGVSSNRPARRRYEFPS